MSQSNAGIDLIKSPLMFAANMDNLFDELNEALAA
jgi:hypothetical protein